MFTSMDGVQDWLNTLFSPCNISDPDQYDSVRYSFEMLCWYYIKRQRSNNLQGIIEFDPIATKAALQRFHRDAFGVYNFSKSLSSLVDLGKVSKDAQEDLLKGIKNLGVRINSKNPRKTRIAAAFAFWISTMKPMSLRSNRCENFKETQLSTICGACIFWIAALYLRQYGNLELGSGQDKIERLNRIQYDLTYRGLTLSSLEMLFCSILRVDEAVIAAATAAA